jgi:hypothetical protein
MRDLVADRVGIVVRDRGAGGARFDAAAFVVAACRCRREADRVAARGVDRGADRVVVSWC